MAGITSFRITLAVKNDTVLPELAARAKDLSVVFDNVIGEWVAGNERKFARGMGASDAGIDQDTFAGGATRWKGLTERYAKQKEREGFPDWLMVRTGELMNAMTTRDALGEAIGPQQAIFGMPLDEEQADKVIGNWGRRQTIFLDRRDRLGIEREIKNYMQFGGNYRELMFAQGLQAAARRDEVKRMDAEFQFRMSEE